MSRIEVVELGANRFAVEVEEGHVRTSHKIAVSEDLVEDLGLDAADAAELVYESFEFLLDREPATSILGDFPLDQIGEHFPEYYDEVRRRMGRA